eukprot:6206070-Pleurochrysis_carterae.AAC.2
MRAREDGSSLRRCHHLLRPQNPLTVMDRSTFLPHRTQYSGLRQQEQSPEEAFTAARLNESPKARVKIDTAVTAVKDWEAKKVHGEVESKKLCDVRGISASYLCILTSSSTFPLALARQGTATWLGRARDERKPATASDDAASDQPSVTARPDAQKRYRWRHRERVEAWRCAETRARARARAECTCPQTRHSAGSLERGSAYAQRTSAHVCGRASKRARNLISARTRQGRQYLAVVK